MRKLTIFQGLAGAPMAAAVLIAGCSGGGSRSAVPTAPAQTSTATTASSQTVATSVTFSIPNQSTSSSSRQPQYIPSSALSIVLSWLGDNPSATPAPVATAPSGLSSPNVTTMNVTATTGSGTPPAGQCYTLGSGMTCTAAITLPVGVIDLYIAAYSATNGTGTLYANSVTRIQVNSTGALTAPGTSTAATPSPLSANIATATSAVTLGSAISLTPQGLPVPNATPTAGVLLANLPVNNGTFYWSAASKPTYTGPDGSSITGTNPISPVTITDTDTSGSTCLVYIKSGTATITPCTFASSSSTPASITLTNTGDQYAVLYNSKFLPGAGVKITATIPGSAATATPAPQTVSASSLAVASTAGTYAGVTSTGTILYDQAGKNVYTGTTSATNPLTITAYNSSTGYGTPTNPTVAGCAGSCAAAALTGTTGVTALVEGPDSNIWIAENNGASQTQYVAVYLANSGGYTAAGTSVNSGNWVEYALTASGSTTLVNIASAGGYIWVTDAKGDAWRINPANGAVLPNLAASASNPLKPVSTTLGTAVAAAGSVTVTPAAMTNIFVGSVLEIDYGTTAAEAVTVTATTGTTFSATFANTHLATATVLGPLPGSPVTKSSGAAFTEVPATDAATLGSAIYYGDSTAGQLGLVKLALDTSATPSNKCVSGNSNPCIATGTESANGVGAAPTNVSTDGTNLYVTTGAALFQYTTAFAQTTSFQSFPAGGGAADGMGQGADGWFWTQVTTNGASSVPGILVAKSTTAAAVIGTSAAGACLATGALGAGANGFVLGPDSTLLYAPSAGAQTSPFCGLLY